MDAAARAEADLRDEACLASVGAGEEGALGELYDRHAQALLRVAISILRNRQDAEDLVHDVFVEAWGKAADYDASRGSVRRWLLTRMRSRAIDRLRSLQVARRHAMAEARSPHPGLTAAPQWDGFDRDRARQALLDLPEAQRKLVELSYFEGLTHAELATRCEIPVGTVKSRLSAAMGKLRQSLAAADGGP